MAKKIIVEAPWCLRHYDGLLGFSEIIEAALLSRNLSKDNELFLFYLEEAATILFESKMVITEFALAWEDLYDFLAYSGITSLIHWVDSLSLPTLPEDVSFFNSTSVLFTF